MRFVLVDRVVDLAPGKSIRTLKNVSASEDYFADHFPGAPIMPGALILECFIQAAMLMLGAGDDFGHRPIVRRVRRAAFKQFVRPGDQLIVRCDADDRQVVRAAAMVGGRAVATAVIEFECVPALPGDNPMRALYEELRADPDVLASADSPSPSLTVSLASSPLPGGERQGEGREDKGEGARRP